MTSGSSSLRECYFLLIEMLALVDVPLCELLANPQTTLDTQDTNDEIYIVCRLGNDSQIAAQVLREARPGSVTKDLVGGLVGWAKDVDPNFPVY